MTDEQPQLINLGKEPKYNELFSKDKNDEYEWVRYLIKELKKKESEDYARHLLSFLNG